MTQPHSSISALLAENATRFASRQAILSKGFEVFEHRRLWEQVLRMVDQLNRLGIGRGDKVAIVLPQGPELAVAFLGVACGATAAPLNPADLEKEFAFYLGDLEARALIVMAGDATPARAAASSLGVPLIEMIVSEDGGLDLSGETQVLLSQPGWPWFCTPPARPPARRWFRLPMGTSAHLPATLPGTWSCQKRTPASMSCLFSISTAWWLASWHHWRRAEARFASGLSTRASFPAG
jgi:acyl-CoA synthetase (AMP-forming)/AMP-acid ligase II